MSFAKPLAAFVLAILTASPLVAQDIGIQFAKMPVGTVMTFKQSNGDQWVDTYIGKRRGKHVIRRKKIEDGRRLPVIKMEYDAKGRLVKWGSAHNGNTYSYHFTPYKCEFQFGACKHTQLFRGERYTTDGDSDKFTYNTRKKGDTFTATWKQTSGSPTDGSWRYKLGKYNLRSIETWGRQGSHSIKLISIK